IERAAHDGGDAQGCIAHRERQQDEEPWEDKAQSAKQTTPPTPSGVTQKHAELCSARARQHIHEREAFDEPFFGDPLPPFLELGLHDAHDGWTTVSCSSQLEQVGSDILPVSCEIRLLRDRHLFLPADASRTTADALRLHWAPLACPTSIRTRAAMTSRARPQSSLTAGTSSQRSMRASGASAVRSQPKLTTRQALASSSRVTRRGRSGRTSTPSSSKR